MEDAANDKPAPPSSSALPSSSSTQPSPMHCTMTIDEARAHYQDMVWKEQLKAI
jgi:hypothetical protein